jgi:hypothetical protein
MMRPVAPAAHALACLPGRVLDGWAAGGRNATAASAAIRFASGTQKPPRR